MVNKCNHNLYKIYYRKKKNKDVKQKWTTLNNKYFCDKCQKVIEVE